MNGHSKLNGNGTIDETMTTPSATTTATTTGIVQTKNDINSNTTIMNVNSTTTKLGFRLNGNRYAEHEEYSTGNATRKTLERISFLFSFHSKWKWTDDYAVSTISIWIHDVRRVPLRQKAESFAFGEVQWCSKTKCRNWRCKFSL